MARTIERIEDPPAASAPRDVETPRGAAAWWRAYLHHLRLLRTQAIAWILGIAGGGMAVTAAFEDTYPTLADRERAAASIEGIPAFEALFGRTVELATIEGFVLWRWGGFAVLVVAIWGMLASGKLLRGAEESGHVEPLRAGAITPRGLLGAAVAALATTFAVLAVVVGLGHTAVGMDAATAWAFGATLGLLAMTFAAAGSLAAQVVDSRRRATGLVGIALGVTLGVRVLAAGTGTPDWLWGATPFGWASYLHEVDAARVQVLVAYMALNVILLAGAFALARRDLHAALLRSDERIVHRARPVRGQVGLAARLTAGPALVWGAVLAASGLVFGLMAEDFAEAMGDLPGTVEAAERIGWVLDTPEGVVASMLVFLALVLALFAAAQAAAIREEEASWRIEPILVRAVGRRRWLATRAAVSTAAILVLAVVTALASWIGAAITGNALDPLDLPKASFNLVPIAFMFLGIGIAVLALAPRRTAGITFAAVIVLYLVDLVGGLIDLPEAVLELTPFRHLTAVPAVDVALGPALVMLAVGTAATWIGISVFRRRDLQEA